MLYPSSNPQLASFSRLTLAVKRERSSLRSGMSGACHELQCNDVTQLIIVSCVTTPYHRHACDDALPKELHYHHYRNEIPVFSWSHV